MAASDASVKKATGKVWSEWIEILTRSGAKAWTHQEIVAHLKKKHGLGPWWQQIVTTGYEVAIGRREQGQNQKGLYAVTATKSLQSPPRSVWKFVCSEAGQKLWLDPLFGLKIAQGSQFETADGFFGELRTVKVGQRIRFSWQDPDWNKKTTVQFTIYAKSGKSLAVIDHSDLVSVTVREKMRKRWRKALDQIADQLDCE